MSTRETETDPLLPRPQQPPQVSRWKPHPRWLMPIALVASLARGLTLAARVQIVTRLSCDALHRASSTTDLLGRSEMTSGLSITSKKSIPNSCFTDPEVQASAAQVQMILTVLAGILTALTAGRWGKWGDRSGRNKAMSVALIGLVMAESIYALASLRHLPFKQHGHKLLILAPIFEGLFGSWPTLQANLNAYLSDITPSASTARLFSRFMGILYIGFATGPSIASFVLRQTADKNITPLFFMSAGAYLIAFIYILFIVPESLHSTDKPQANQPIQATQPNEDHAPSAAQSSYLRQLVAPLASLRPRRAGAMHKDYTLTIIGVSYFIYLLSLALYQLKYLYAEHVFSWDAEHLGYYISYMGFARAITLLLLVPMWVYVFRPRTRSGGPASSRRELNFNLSLVRMSILLDVLSHGLVVLLPTDSSTLFVLATTLTSLGSSSIPSYSSTVLGYVRYRAAQGEQEDQDEDVGVLFGALAVLQSLGQTIVGPIIFGVVYSMTISWYPQGVFVLACGCAGVALLLMCIARPRKRLILIGHRKDRPTAYERGRSVMTKDIVRT
ncbi:MFS general substrate transporter [Serendipita vermifera]|nr:MFS general substrate transporter [Serendipita vermifera]